MNEDIRQDYLPILWKDDHYAFINKPADLLIHRSLFSSDRDTLVKRLYSQFENPPLPVHRLDRPVSGVLAASFSSEAAALLSTSFREGKVQKTYRAIVRGFIPAEGVIQNDLKDYETGKVKVAETLYKRIRKAEINIPSKKFPTSRYSLVELQPKTGRFHQIRRHLAGLGYPIVGDTSHGDTFCNHHFTDYFGVSGLMLHALSLNVLHPLTGEDLNILAPLPLRFNNVMKRFGWEYEDQEESLLL